MPKIGEPNPGAHIEAALAELATFTERSAWRPSGNAKQNISREWYGATVTVFKRHGRFSWSISHGQDREPEYSREKYDSEEIAMNAVGIELIR